MGGEEKETTGSDKLKGGRLPGPSLEKGAAGWRTQAGSVGGGAGLQVCSQALRLASVCPPHRAPAAGCISPQTLRCPLLTQACAARRQGPPGVQLRPPDGTKFYQHGVRRYIPAGGAALLAWASKGRDDRREHEPRVSVAWCGRAAVVCSAHHHSHGEGESNAINAKEERESKRLLGKGWSREDGGQWAVNRLQEVAGCQLLTNINQLTGHRSRQGRG